MMIPTEMIPNAMSRVDWADEVTSIGFGLQIVTISVCDATIKYVCALAQVALAKYASLPPLPPYPTQHERLPQEPTPKKP